MIDLTEYHFTLNPAIGSPTYNRIQRLDCAVVVFLKIFDHVVVINRVAMARMQGRRGTPHQNSTRYFGLQGGCMR